MKVKDMTDYLASFDPDKELSIVVIDPKARIRYPVKRIIVIEEEVFIGVEVSGGEPLDEEQIKAAEEDEMRKQEEQM